MKTPATPTLDYRSKAITPSPLPFNLQLRSNPPRKDLFFLIRVSFILLTVYLLNGGNICFSLGSTWYAGHTADGFVVMQLHPNYAERLEGFLFHTRPPAFVYAVLAQPNWPYALWFFPPTWLLATLWLLAMMLTCRLTSVRTKTR